MDTVSTESRELFPLSLSQQNIWDVERACPNTPVNNISTTLHIWGRVDFSLLRRGIDLVLGSDPSLRTRITLRDGVPFQYHAPFTPEDTPVYDFSQTSAAEIEAWQNAVTREVLPLLDAPLCRFALLRTGENSGSLLVKTHHIISDGWSQALLCNRIGQAYLDLLAGKEPDAAPSPSYRSHVEEETEYLSSPAYARDEAYWRSALEQAGEPCQFKAARGAAVSPVGRRRSFPLPEDVNNAVYAFCVNHRVAPFSVFCMALATYFKRIGGAERATIGVPIFNRMNYAAKQTSGMFVSTLPFSVQVCEDWSLTQFNEQFSLQWFELLRHQRFPFSRIQALSGGRGAADARLFHVAFSYQNSQLLESRDASVRFSGRWHYSGYQLEQLCIHLSNVEDDRRYEVDYDYQAQLFSAQEIDSLHACLVNILRAALAEPDKPVGQLPLLSPGERERVLYSFNRTARPIFEPGLYDRFARAVRAHPDRAALICGGERLPYAALEEQAARVHAALEGLCAGPDALIAVLLPRRPALFAAMMGILRAGGAFVLLPPGLPENRVRDILTQSGAAALLTDAAAAAPYDLNRLLPLVSMDRLPPPTSAPPVDPGPAALAYVVYTSGSTGTPKGVEIERRSLLNLVCAMEPVYAKGAVLSLCSIGFDAFLLESAVALLNGRTILLPEDAELESPQALARLITGYGAGFLSTTPSRLAAFLKHPEFRKAAGRLETVLCGGEAFPGDLLQRLQLLTNARIYNQYGPSEATVGVSLKQLNDAPAVTAGAPMANCKLYVLDRRLSPLPAGVYGDLYIGGLCVGRGYRSAPELTAQAFLDSPFEQGGRLYRTGDTACWTEDGEIVLAGRSDRQVKLRGLRVEPQEVSACLARHPLVRECAACVKDQDGQPVLAAYYTSDQPIPEGELLALAASWLPHYMIPAAILRLDALPLTPNGKVDEGRLPSPGLPAGGGEAETPLQAELLGVFRRVLGKPGLGVEDDYFLHGGNSLNAMEALGDVAERTGLSLRVADLYACRSARRLAELAQERSGAAPAAGERLRPAPPQARWPLTPIQQGIYFQSFLDPTGRAYHMAGAFRLSAPPDVPRLERAFRALIAEEPLLRAVFVQEDGGVFAKVLPSAGFSLFSAAGETLEQAAAPLLAPFDLSAAPLLRAGLWEEAPGRWVLLLATHHIIGDGLTTPILMARLDALYRGAPVTDRPLSFLDYAWRLARQEGEAGRLDYWKARLSPLPEPLDLPCDFNRPRTADFRGNTLFFPLSAQVSAACDDCCGRLGVTPYMFFLGVFGLLLSRLSGKHDLTVGAAAAGRLLPETRELCGPFISSLPLRLQPEPQLTLAAWLDAVRAEVNGMLDHQQAGVEEIAAALNLPRTLAQSPLFQVLFTQRPLDAGAFTLDGAPMAYLSVPTGTAKMDLNLELSRDGARYCLTAEYASSLFLEETVSFWLRCFETLAGRMARCAPDSPLSALDPLSPRDRMELLDLPQNTVAPFVNLPIPRLFERQLALDPDAPAVIFHGAAVSRRELDRRACRMANLLTAAGAAPGGQVGIAMSRSADLAAAVLAVWKTGCAYVPLLAHYPEQRLASMAETARISHILCDPAAREKLPASLPCTLVSTQGDAPDTFQAVPLKETDLAEVLFTSGSTGNPKGVMLGWRSVANMVAGFGEILNRVEGPILCTTNVVFDMFNGEVTIPLALGKPIVMADEEEMMLPWKLAQLIRRDGVRVTQSTPSRVQMWLTNEDFRQAAAGLGMMIYGGEVLTETLLRAAQAAAPDAVMTNMYGPTEGTVYNTTTPADWRGHINIGRPMRNNRIYVLDEALNQVLPTAAGDLYLAGECLSLGYISRPDLTEAAFLPDPFCPGALVYRTGDLARLRIDGSYDFLGRRDAQVKLNGQRVELDEINGALVSAGCALQAATVPVRRADGSMELFTYYIPGEPLDAPAIRARLGKVLPAYMIPSHLAALERMPSTPTGKIDLRTLKEWAQNGIPAQAEPLPPAPAPEDAAPEDPPPAQAAPGPAGPTQAQLTPGSLDWVLDLWGRVLCRAQVDPDRSFFEQGGTSLAALNVLSHYQNARLELTLAQFYDDPTARAHAERFAAGADGTPAAPPADLRAAAFPAAPAKDPRDAERAGPAYPRFVPSLPAGRKEQRDPDTVLLTGATGFLGIHLLRALADAGTRRILCTMRDASRDRLLDALSWYFGGAAAADLEPLVEIVPADLTKPGLGLSPGDYQALSGRIGAVWHCAADVRHYAADEAAFLSVNVAGTEALIKLARAANAPLYHMSTLSVGGNRLVGSDVPARFTEHDFDLGQDWRSNLYIRSKFLAEHAVFEAARAGLTARVFRLGRLVGRAADGAFQRRPEGNAFWLLMRAVHDLGAIPASLADAPVELTPVDWCARAAAALRRAPMAALHIQNPHPPTLAETARAVCPNLRVLPDGAFSALLDGLPADGRYAPLLDYRRQLETAPPTITVSSAATQAALDQAGFREPIPGPDRLLRAFRFDATERGDRP